MELMRIFFGVSMSNGHQGLHDILRKNNLSVERGYALFVNRSWTAAKLTTPANGILHVKASRQRPIDPETLKYLPRCIEGPAIDYGKALHLAMINDYKRVSKRR